MGEGAAMATYPRSYRGTLLDCFTRCIGVRWYHCAVHIKALS